MPPTSSLSDTQLTMSFAAGADDHRPRVGSTYLTDQLVTYIGNKRTLLPRLDAVAREVRGLVGRDLVAADVFSGSGVVSRMLKAHSARLVSNDLEPYAAVLSRCYLANHGEVPWRRVQYLINEFNTVVAEAESTDGFIERLYAPTNDDAILPGERVFFTRDNARRLDHYRQLIGTVDEAVQPFLLAPLLSAASIHANTAGVFKGFYKDRLTGIGRFGGLGQDALSRIKGTIELRPPVLGPHSCDLVVHRHDANALAAVIGAVDLAYLDPPYNQHPYGSNYFMLNLLVDYKEPDEISPVSGIPVDWQRSGYNVRKRSLGLMTDLVEGLNARYLLVSFNDEGFIAPDVMMKVLASVGKVREFTFAYNTYRGSRNLGGRAMHVTEHLYLVEKRA